MIIAKQADLRDCINYLTNMKNKHEERICTLERELPDDLDKRIRDMEVKMYLVSVVVPIFISILMFCIQKTILKL